MLVRNPIEHDTRVRKEARSLRAAGHDVCVFGIAAPSLPPEADDQGVLHVRVVVDDRLHLAYRRLRHAWDADRRPGRCRVATARLRRLRRRAGKRVYGRVRWLARPLTAQLDFLAAVRRPVEAYAPTVVHAHDLNTLLAGWWLSRRWGAPLVYDAHELELHASRSWTPPKRAILRTIEGLGIRRARAVLTVSPLIAGELARTYRVRRPQVLLNSPPLATRDESPALDLRAAADLRDGERLLLYVGTLVPRGRGIAELLEALALLPAAVHLGFMGPAGSGASQAVESMATRHHVASRVHFFGPVPSARVPATMRAADAALIPTPNICRSHDLSLPNKLFDAVMAGVPLAVSDLTHLREFVGEHELGELFDATDPRSIAAAATRVLGGRPRGVEDRERLRRLQEEVAWEHQGHALVRLYAELAAASS